MDNLRITTSVGPRFELGDHVDMRVVAISSDDEWTEYTLAATEASPRAALRDLLEAVDSMSCYPEAAPGLDELREEADRVRAMLKG